MSTTLDRVALFGSVKTDVVGNRSSPYRRFNRMREEAKEAHPEMWEQKICQLNHNMGRLLGQYSPETHFQTGCYPEMLKNGNIRKWTARTKEACDAIVLFRTKQDDEDSDDEDNDVSFFRAEKDRQTIWIIKLSFS